MVDWSRIEFLCGEADRHLNEIEAVKTALQNVRDLLHELKESSERRYLDELQEMREQLNFLTEHLRERGLTPTDKYEMELLELKKILTSDEWPEAVEPELICDESNIEEMLEACENILDSVVTEYLKDTKFLDFGCGHGCMAATALKQKPVKSVGFDIKEHAFWDSLRLKSVQLNLPELLLTTSFDEVQNNGLYDVVLMHDVLDHIVGNPVRVLKDISEIMNKDGKLFIACHPWCSRHGGHLYKKLNKAFLHLVFDETELARIHGMQTEHTIRVVYPLKQYEEWFNEAGFSIINKSPKFTKVESFFRDSKIKNRIMKNWPESEGSFPEYHMSIDFVNYILKPTNANKLAEII